MDELNQSPLLKNLPDDVRTKIKEKGEKSNYPSEDIIFDREDPGKKFYAVLEGLVKITIPDPVSERNKTLALLGPGEVLGEMAVLSDNTRSGRATAARRTQLFELDDTTFRSLMQEIPQLGINLSRILSKRLWNTDSEIQAVTFQTIPGRLASQLLRLSEQFGVSTSDGPKIDIELTHQELADIVGTNRETITRHLNKFKEKDIITTNDGKIVVKNQDRLEGWM